jgi:RNA polymerase sigma-70 factor, ECF subfamily
MTTPLNDEVLAIQARGHAESFAELYRRYVTRVYRYHLVHTGNVKDAEDLTSQTFMAALDGIGRYRRVGVFAAWLMGIARRQMALFFRSRKPEIGLDQADDLPAPATSVDLQVGERLALQQARTALKNLSPERAEALILVTFGGLSVSEAAQTLGKSEAAVKMLVSRGLQDLRVRSRLAVEVEA